MQVTIIGGGSYQWSPKLITDLLGVAPLADMKLVLEDIDPQPLPKMEAYAKLANEKMGTKMTVETTTDQRRALDGADFVIVTISTGGFESMGFDIDIPAAHGIAQSVGDSVGPGGISRSLRNIPVLVSIGRDMEQCCPDAWMLNITNPMTCLTRSVCRETAIKTVGLCHEVGHFCMDLAIAFSKPHTAVRPTVMGVNHFPVITALDIDGADGLALLREMVDELGGLEALRPGPDRPEAEPFSRADFAYRHALKLTLLDRYGALPGAGDRHVAEFIPSALTEESQWAATWGIELTPMARRLAHQDEFVAEVDAVLAGTADMQTWDSGEIVAPVIDSLLTGTTRELPVNLPNCGQCPDLPADVVVESICLVDGDGMRGRDAVRAPAGITEWVRRQVAVQELTVEAAVTGDKSLVLQAFALDPLAGRGDLREIEADGRGAAPGHRPLAAPIRIGAVRIMKVGFIGLGAMGLPMTRNLLAAGHEVTVTSRSRPPIDAAVALGATDAVTVTDLARAAEVVILCVPNSPEVVEVVDALLPGLGERTIVVDCSTIDPDVERAQHEKVRATGARYLDGPLSGGTVGAEKGTLTVMVGGDPATLDEARPALDAVAGLIVHVGGPGMGQVVKLCNNLIYAAQMVATAEATALAVRSGVDMAKLLEVLLHSTGDCTAVRTRLPVAGVLPDSPASNGWKPGFMTDLMAKDLDLALAYGARAGVPLTTTAGSRQVLTAASTAGYGREDFSALAKIVLRSAGLNSSAGLE